MKILSALSFRPGYSITPRGMKPSFHDSLLLKHVDSHHGPLILALICENEGAVSAGDKDLSQRLGAWFDGNHMDIIKRKKSVAALRRRLAALWGDGGQAALAFIWRGKCLFIRQGGAAAYLLRRRARAVSEEPLAVLGRLCGRARIVSEGRGHIDRHGQYFTTTVALRRGDGIFLASAIIPAHLDAARLHEALRTGKPASESLLSRRINVINDYILRDKYRGDTPCGLADHAEAALRNNPPDRVKAVPSGHIPCLSSILLRCQ